MGIQLPASRSLSVNPSQDELKRLVAQMPNAQLTEFGNYNVKARVTARSGGSTFVIMDDPSRTTKPTMPRADYADVVARQLPAWDVGAGGGVAGAGEWGGRAWLRCLGAA